MPSVPCLQIDSFTDRAFAGNPAAVCLVDRMADEAWMQAVAAEMNLAETAFVAPRDDGLGLRWFTPTVEVDLCGHATLAAAHALWSEGRIDDAVPIHFHTRSGLLTCRRDGDWIELDFPATPAAAAEPLPGMLAALGIEPVSVGLTQTGNYLVVVDDERQLRGLSPDFAALRDTTVLGVIVTSQSTDERFDFISRFFAPNAGIDEDSVTGSAHCCLGPYWSERLGKPALTAFQASARGGVVHVRVAHDRVVLRGQAVTVLRGLLTAAAAYGA